MVFLFIGSHSFRVLVGDPNCPSLTDYGLIALKRIRDLQLEGVLSLKKIKLSQLMPGKEMGYKERCTPFLCHSGCAEESSIINI